jgi:hypothetical protein
MPLTAGVLNGILNSIKSSFVTAYLTTSGTSLIDTAVSGAPKIDGAKTLSWATATNGFSISTTNSATSNPLNYSVPQSTVLTRLFLVDSGGTIRGTITLPAVIPTYTTGAGPYYVRGLTLTISEVV